MTDPLSNEELGDERAELLPDREVLSLLTDPTAMQAPSFLGGPVTPDTGATTTGATDVATHHLPETPAGDVYSPTETATAG
jgi:hypothetical protein